MLDSIERTQELLRVPVAKRKVAWARLLCEAGRDVYLDVWAYSLLNSDVQPAVLKLYDDAIDAFRNLLQTDVSDIERGELRDFLGNAVFRREDLANNYLNGKSPELVTKDRIKALRAEVS